MSVAFSMMFRETMRFKRLLPWCLLALFAGMVAFLWRQVQPDATPTERYTSVMSLLVYRVLPLISAILTTMVVSQEVERKTIVFLLTRPIARWKLLLGRFAAVTLSVALLTFFSLLIVRATVGFGVVKTSLIHEFAAICLGALAYGSLFLLISLFLHRAIMGCILFAFGWETSVPNFPAGVQTLSILRHMQNISGHKSEEGRTSVLDFVTNGISADFASPSTSMIGLGILSLVLTAMAAMWFTHNEFVPREDN
jgi:ABC-2 type transport system permease protein